MFIEKLIKKIQSSQKRYPQHVNHISSIGFPCDRFLVYSRVRWADREMPSPGLLMIFNEGRHQERSIKMDLLNAGVEILRTEEPIWFEKEQLSGSTDGMIKRYRAWIGIEIKSVSSHIFPRLNTAGDLMRSKLPYHQCYIPQLQLYMYGKDLKRGIFILKNKNTGELKEIEIKLDKRLCRGYLNKCKVINNSVDKINGVLKETYQIKEIADFDKMKDAEDYKAIKKEACELIEKHLPERITCFETCEYCSCQHICLPDEIREERAKVYVSTDEFISKLIRREELIEAKKEYTALDAEVKKHLKDTKEKYLIIMSEKIEAKFEVEIKPHGKGERVDITKQEQEAGA